MALNLLPSVGGFYTGVENAAGSLPNSSPAGDPLGLADPDAISILDGVFVG